VAAGHAPSGQVFKEAERRGPPDRHQSPTGRLDQQPAVCYVDLRPFRARPAGASVLAKPAANVTSDSLPRLQAVSVERRMEVPAMLWGRCTRPRGCGHRGTLHSFQRHASDAVPAFLCRRPWSLRPTCTVAHLSLAPRPRRASAGRDGPHHGSPGTAR